MCQSVEPQRATGVVSISWGSAPFCPPFGPRIQEEDTWPTWYSGFQRRDLRVHNQSISTHLAPAEAKPGPVLSLGSCLSCGSRSPALVSQGNGTEADKRGTLWLATRLRSEIRSVGRICFCLKRGCGALSLQTVSPLFLYTPSMQIPGTSGTLFAWRAQWQHACLPAVREVQGYSSNRKRQP